MDLSPEECRHCPGCCLDKPLDAFPSYRKGVQLRRNICRECYLERRRESWRKYDEQRNAARREKWVNDTDYRAANKESCARYRAKNKDNIAAKLRDRNRAVRHRVLNRYGGKCVCCNEPRTEFLVIDHTDGGGTAERKLLSPNGVYRKLDKASDLLSGYRVLCHNCNSAYAYYGYCPHNLSSAIDPGDAGMLDVVGFDTAAPQVIGDFVR